jgi:hypothetical protein
MNWFQPSLSNDEMNPSARRGGVKTQAYFDSGDAKAIGEHLKAAQAQVTTALGQAAVRQAQAAFRGVDPSGLTPGAGDTPDLGDLLAEFAKWSPAGSDVDVLHQKATVLKGLLQNILAGADRDRVARLCVELLVGSGAQRQNPAEWMWQVKSLSSAMGAGAADLFRASGDPGLLVYLAGLP